MTIQQISAADIVGWDSLRDIADSFEKRGLKPRPALGEDAELVLQLADDEFVVLVNAGPGESATDFKPDNRSQHTNLVATDDFEEFTFLTRIRSWEGQQHGRIKHQKLSFTKDQFAREGGEKNTVLKKLNAIEYGSSAAIYDTLYDTQRVVEEFYEEFEALRTDLVQHVAGIPDDRGDAKQRYVQVVLDRMIFLYFIQEKRLLDRNSNYLHEQPAAIVDDGEDRYEQFYRPLFFDYLAEKNQHPNFGMLPYLNGGLFAKNPVEEAFPDAKLGGSATETNALFDDILDFLSDWNWNVDERLDIVDPKNLSPAILGHIFEQTVNQKEMGAYYTPEEITGFMSRRTIHPYLVDQLNEAVGAEYEAIDDVFGFAGAGAGGGAEVLADGGTMTPQVPTENVQTTHVETLYHDILKEAHVLDPAVGSGAFLLAAQDVLVDIYMQCIEFFEQLERESRGWELESRTRDELEAIDAVGNASLFSKRTVILNNLYGVDIDEGAVEICKLRLWLSMVADIEDEPREVEPLPNIDFNIRQGNSLIGFTDLMEVNSNGDASLTNYGYGIGESIEKKYEDIIEAVEKHRAADSGDDATNWRKEAERHLDTYRDDLNEKVLKDFKEAGVEDITKDGVEDLSPFHWVLEFAIVYADGGFNVVVGNPPWDMLQPRRDEFFTRYDETFRTLPPKAKDELEEELREDEEVQKAWKEYDESFKLRSQFFTDGHEYELQWGEIDGRTRTGRNDLSMLLLERTFDLTEDSGYVSQILPGKIFTNGTTKNLRVHLLEETSIESIVGFENKGIFKSVDNRYNFGLLTFQNCGSTDSFKGIFLQRSVEVLRSFDEISIEIPRKVVNNHSPEAITFPFIRSKTELNALKKILQHPRISNKSTEGWYADGYIEIYTRDSDYFSESQENADYPVYGGSNMFQYAHNSEFFGLEEPEYWSIKEETNPERSAKHRVREKNLPHLKRMIYSSFDGESTSKSQKKFVDDLLNEHRGEGLKLDDVTLDCTEYRIAFRNIARSSDERTFIASVLPPGIICYHALTTIRPYHIDVTEADLSENPLKSVYKRAFTDEELFALIGMLNSIPFDFLMRTKVDTNISQYKFDESPVPRLTAGDNWFKYISQRAAMLNCYGDEFKQMRERLGGLKAVVDEEKRKTIQAEIDAAVFHAYGLNRRDTEFILNDFHRVSNPRIMTEEYFDLVFKNYKTLEKEGPKP